MLDESFIDTMDHQKEKSVVLEQIKPGFSLVAIILGHIGKRLETLFAGKDNNIRKKLKAAG